MSLRDLALLVPRSGVCFPGTSVGALKLRTRFVAAGMRNSAAIPSFLNPEPGTALSRIMTERPQMLGALIWPYQCAGWDAATRFQRMSDHYREIDRIGAPFEFAAHEKLVIADLNEYHPGLRLVVDQPHWFMREGGLVLNMFVDSLRAFSLAFSFYRRPDGQLGAAIGGLQGRNVEDALGVYRALTKSLFGLRPRDFLLEAFRMLCRILEVVEITAVTQAHRHHQHAFFGQKELSPDYDTIWEDRAGIKRDAHFYELSVAPETRDLATVKPNKRSLYRKRFAFVDTLEAQITETLPGVLPTTFTDT